MNIQDYSAKTQACSTTEDLQRFARLSDVENVYALLAANCGSYFYHWR